MPGPSSLSRLIVLLLAAKIAGGFSGDDESYQSHRYGRLALATPLRRRSGVDSQNPMPPLRYKSHALPLSLTAKRIPSTVPESHFRQAPQDHSELSLLAKTDDDAHMENTPISARHIVTMALQVDVRQLNVSLLRTFREGVAAALDISPRRVHIKHLNEQKNGIELYVSSDRAGASEPVSSEEVIRSLNLNTLHSSLGPFGITEVSSENVLQGQHERDNVWSNESFYVVVIFLTTFIIVVTCLMVLYRLKEKAEYSNGQLKGLGVPVSATQPPLTLTSSMVQAGPIPKPACTTATSTRPSFNTNTTQINHSSSHTHNSACSAESQCPPCPPCPTVAEFKPCLSSSPSPFKMKPAAGLQERRGSNVSLVLDMSALGSVEPLNCRVNTPRQRVAQEYLQSASRVLTRQQLRDATLNTHSLHAEFAEIPMNFVDPKDLDIPSLGTKNRYKTILPNPHSSVLLKNKNSCDPLSSYINANYIRGYLRHEKSYIATQGPMINTVNDFWQMAWQEDSPIIVMITKLKEKNEKCVLYWPEKRGIYGKVEVLVNSVRECEHYTVRTLTLKQGGQSRKVQHYWYTSWPDHKTPDSAGPLLQLMTDVEESREASESHGPVIVHCSAGIGRTGCFIATTIGCHQLLRDGVVDVLGIVCQMRVDRGGMIQTGEQYEFVHHALCLYEGRLSADPGP
ncbi:receptor-type tyrosine-protein phosphatase R isoform X2 [Tachysurus vachellii]|uniref:receptor-type tyrosine-protein phosphatase R isoform X2 n=1 Tax=Tachysurus vachellii TaxID=175792 RepID=UPI00296B28F3|nr:receptor-type tyrosine-protein phosphatase R isoform X2 [Tachysurus vachellii]